MTTKTGYGEVLPPGMVRCGRLNPRFRGAGGAFRDENLDLLSRVLDTWFRVPGTSIRFGLDGIIGFIPGIGDFLGRAGELHHRAGRVLPRRADGDDRADGREPWDRGGHRRDSVRGQPVRHRVASEPAQLLICWSAASRRGGGIRGRIGCSCC